MGERGGSGEEEERRRKVRAGESDEEEVSDGGRCKELQGGCNILAA